MTVVDVPFCFTGLGSRGYENLYLVHLIFHNTSQLFDFEAMAGAHTVQRESLPSKETCKATTTDLLIAEII